MSRLSAFFLFCALLLSVSLGAQTRSWSWGPALLALAFATLTAIPVFFKHGRAAWPGWGVFLIGLSATVWFASRALQSPVQEFGNADLMLLASAVASFVACRAAISQKASAGFFIWAIALLLCGDLVVLGMQMADPSVSFPYALRPYAFPSGFFGHYNDGANFLLATSFLLAGAALIGNHHKASRILWAIISILGFGAVYFTHSRGGILAVGVGGAVFMLFALIHGKQQKSAWFIPLAIATPILLILAIGLFLKGWASTQELRFGTSADTVMDNPIRLFLLGIAFSCIGLHPWAGGGSRSFSWECYRFWEFQEHGGAAFRPEMVHNELLQSATDYGLIGALLVGTLIAWAILAALVRTATAKSIPGILSANAWRIGGAAALAGMLCQSSFSFVFHILPGTVLLGICLAFVTAPAQQAEQPSREGSAKSFAFLLTSVACASALFLIPMGWINSRLSLILLPLYLKSDTYYTENGQIAKLTEALAISPQASFFKERAFLFQKLSEDKSAEVSTESARQSAIADYQSAILLHPFDATLTVNLANLFSAAGNEPAAEKAYEETIRLQGGMEPGFRGHFFYAEHLLKKGVKQLNSSHSPEALLSFNSAVSQIESIKVDSPWVLNHPEGLKLKAAVYEGLGLACEANEDMVGAIEAFTEMAQTEEGAAGYYRIANLQAKTAARKWSERKPAEALALFLRAKDSMLKAQKLPTDIPGSQKLQLRQYIEESILFLQKARITPSTPDQ